MHPVIELATPHLQRRLIHLSREHAERGVTLQQNQWQVISGPQGISEFVKALG